SKDRYRQRTQEASGVLPRPEGNHEERSAFQSEFYKLQRSRFENNEEDGVNPDSLTNTKGSEASTQIGEKRFAKQ
ncbi:MAG: hypothetical protein ACPGO5_05155, partial [Patescibacteria group bacterium]